MTETSKRRQQLLDEGFCVFSGLLGGDLLGRLRLVSDRLLDAYPEEEKQRRGNQGSVVSIAYQDRAFAELIAWPPTWAALRELGFERARYWGGSVIAKEPHSTPLYWHQDWVWWEEPESADPVPHQLFLMWYLTDTRPENGCLRVLPQSHRRRLDAHELIGTHDDGIRHLDPATSPRLPDAARRGRRGGGGGRPGGRRLAGVARGPCQHHRPAPDRAHDVVPAAFRRTERAAARRLSGTESSHRRAPCRRTSWRWCSRC